MARTVELAFGADRSDPNSWVWTDVSADVLSRVVEIQTGIQDEMSTAQPGRCTVVLDNNTGKFTPGHPLSPHYPHVVEGTPMRVTVDGNIRFVGVVASWEPEWPHGDLAVTTDLDDDGWKLGDARVTVTATGVLGEIAAAETPLHSPLWRTIMAQPGLLAYWPLEDGEGAASGSSPVPGVSAAQIRSSVALGQGPVSTGSGPSALISATVGTDPAAVLCWVPPLSEDGWAVESVFRIEPDTGDGLVWRMSIWDDAGQLWEIDATLADPNLTISLRWYPDADDTGTSTTLASETVAARGPHQVRLRAALPVLAAERRWALDVDGEELARDGATGGSDPTDIGHPTRVGVSAAGVLCGHISVYEYFPDSGFFLLGSTFDAVLGWDGEPAATRLIRLCMEEGISPEVQARPAVVDTFDRVETDSWGAPDIGPAWVTHGTDASFSVNGSQGLISDPDGAFPEAATLGEVGDPAAAFGDVHILVRMGVEGGSSIGIVTRCDPLPGIGIPLEAGCYQFGVFRSQAADVYQIGIDRRDADGFWQIGRPTLVAGAGPWWMRVVCAGPWLLCKVWLTTDPEPTQWTQIGYDTFYKRGVIGLFSNGSNAVFEDLRVESLDESTLCGPQSIDTLISVMDKAAKVEAGGGWTPILTERRDALGLLVRTRASMYNQDAKLSLDASDGPGDIVTPLLPVLDNRGKADAVIVTRTGGTSVRRVVNTPIRRTVALDLDVHSDTQLPDLAGWAAAHTTWPGMRYPLVSPALAIVPALVADWVKLIPGDRIDLTGLPPQHPAGTVELMLLGTVEEIDANMLRGRAVCAPYGPYRVGLWQEVGATPDPDAPARYSPEDSVTAGQFVAGTDTELMVTDQTGDHDLWTTDPGAYPLDIVVSGVRLRVTAASGASSPQMLTVAQAPVNGVTKTIPAGSKVELWRPARYAL